MINENDDFQIVSVLLTFESIEYNLYIKQCYICHFYTIPYHIKVKVNSSFLLSNDIANFIRKSFGNYF